VRAAAARGRDARERTVLEEVVARAREHAGWAAVNARYRTRLAEQVNVPIVEIPFLFTEEFGFAEVKVVAEHMCHAPLAARRGQRA